MTEATGQKFDADKERPTLLMSGCRRAIAGIVTVLSFGFRKYGKENGWKEVPNLEVRYRDALYRHLAAYERGETHDPESGLPHLDHLACNAIFLSETFHAQNQKELPTDGKRKEGL